MFVRANDHSGSVAARCLNPAGATAYSDNSQDRRVGIRHLRAGRPSCRLATANYGTLDRATS
jgi:hypothetical protein